METCFRDCKLIAGSDNLIAESLVVDLKPHRKAFTSPESTVLWGGLIRTNQTIAVSVGDTMTLQVPGLEHRIIEILEPQKTGDKSIQFRGMGTFPIAINDVDE